MIKATRPTPAEAIAVLKIDRLMAMIDLTVSAILAHKRKEPR